MKKVSYKDAIRWIATNDKSNGGESAAVHMVADLFDVTPAKVANDVAKDREKDK